MAKRLLRLSPRGVSGHKPVICIGIAGQLTIAIALHIEKTKKDKDEVSTWVALKKSHRAARPIKDECTHFFGHVPILHRQHNLG